jgi:preprotein translocase subunit YajC
MRIVTRLLTIAMLISTVFTDEVGSEGGVSIFMMLPMLFGIYYLMVLRPEQKKQGQLDALRDGIRIGDTVVAIGIVGKVLNITDDTFILESNGNSSFEVLKVYVSETRDVKTVDVKKTRKKTTRKTKQSA